MRARHLEILGLSLFALVSVMAVSASAAQAEWLLLLNQSSVSSITGTIQLLPFHFYVEELELTISCTGGTATTTLTGSKVLSVSNTTTVTGCAVTGGEEVCEVHSSGQPDGTIVGSDSGPMDDSGPEEVLALLSSSKISEIEIDGEECSVGEFDATLSGSLRILILEALQDLTTHLVHIEDCELFYGTHSVSLLSSEGSAILGHARDQNPNATWAIHLVNL